MILLLISGVVAVFLGIHASSEAECSLKWSIVSIVCGLFVLLGLIIVLAICKADLSVVLGALIFIIPAIVEIFFGVDGVSNWSMGKEEKTKQLLTDKQNTLIEKRRSLVSDINKLKSSQQKILDKWTNFICGEEFENEKQNK